MTTMLGVISPAQAPPRFSLVHTLDAPGNPSAWDCPDSFKERNLFSAFGRLGYHRSAYSHNLLVTSLLFQFRQHLEVLTPTRELCLDDQYSDCFSQ
jgi:hypothetical protein